MPRATRSRVGFTLIELIVVTAVLLILIGIGIGSFLGFRDGARDANAKSQVTIAYTNAKAEWADAGSYPSEASLRTALEEAEPGLWFVTDEADPLGPGPDGRPTVYLDVTVDPLLESAGPTVTLCARSTTDTVFCLRANEDGNLQGQLS